jgi:hypothetical protein
LGVAIEFPPVWLFSIFLPFTVVLASLLICGATTIFSIALTGGGWTIPAMDWQVLSPSGWNGSPVFILFYFYFIFVLPAYFMSHPRLSDLFLTAMVALFHRPSEFGELSNFQRTHSFPRSRVHISVPLSFLVVLCPRQFSDPTQRDTWGGECGP